MSEKKGPFDDFMVAANEALISAEQFAGSMIPLLRATTKLGGISIAIRVLEAAGRVDKENALWNIDEAFSQGRGHVEMMAPYNADHNLDNYHRADKEITALLESLPEKEEQ